MFKRRFIVNEKSYSPTSFRSLVPSVHIPQNGRKYQLRTCKYCVSFVLCLLSEQKLTAKKKKKSWLLRKLSNLQAYKTKENIINFKPNVIKIFKQKYFTLKLRTKMGAFIHKIRLRTSKQFYICSYTINLVR